MVYVVACSNVNAVQSSRSLPVFRTSLFHFDFQLDIPVVLYRIINIKVLHSKCYMGKGLHWCWAVLFVIKTLGPPAKLVDYRYSGLTVSVHCVKLVPVSSPV